MAADPELLARHVAVLALRVSGAALAQRCPRRPVSEVEMRLHHGQIRYRRPGRRGAWALIDPDYAELQRRERRYLADLDRILSPLRLPAARAARARLQAEAKAARDALIVDFFEALGRAPCARPVHDRAGIVAAQLGVSAQHVRKVMAEWHRLK